MALILKSMMICRTTLKHTFQHVLCKSHRYKVITSIPKPKYFSTAEAEKESVSSEKCRIYSAPLGSDIRRVKLAVLITSSIGVASGPYLFMRAAEVDHIFPTIFASWLFVFFMITPFLCHLLTRKYVLYLHYIPSKDLYTATVYDFFARRYEVEFTPKDVKLPTIEGMLTNLIIKGRRVFIDHKLYTHRDHFIKIMSYDQPIDFKLGSVNNIEYLIPDQDKPQLKLEDNQSPEIENENVEKIASGQTNK